MSSSTSAPSSSASTFSRSSTGPSASPSHFVLLALDGLLTRSLSSQALAQVEQEQEEREDDAAGQAVEGGRPSAAGAGARLERSPLPILPHRFHLSPFQSSEWMGCSVARRFRGPSLPRSPFFLLLDPCPSRSRTLSVRLHLHSLHLTAIMDSVSLHSALASSSSSSERDARARTSQLASAALKDGEPVRSRARRLRM